MPAAEMTCGGNLSATVGYFGGQLRTNMAFLELPWLSANFRYNGTKDLNLFGYSTFLGQQF